jgi:hypothetical protein
MPKVIASWIERFAVRVLQLQPGRQPLDAVRAAVAVFEDESHRSPEAAAEAHVARLSGDARPMPEDHGAAA